MAPFAPQWPLEWFPEKTVICELKLFNIIFTDQVANPQLSCLHSRHLVRSHNEPEISEMALNLFKELK